jgi:hypothetical protein
MQQQARFQNYEQEQHRLGGEGGGNATPPAPIPPPPTPPTPPAAPAAPTAQQTQQIDQRLYAPQGFQSTVLSTNNNTSAGVTKKTILGG